MEYMESKMQEQIEAGFSEADRCYARIAELEEQNAALAAQFEALRDALICIRHSPDDHCAEIAADVLDKTPQQHLAEIKAQAGELGYYNGFKDALVIEPPLQPATGTSAKIDVFAYRVEQASRCAANQYADSIRRGEVI